MKESDIATTQGALRPAVFHSAVPNADRLASLRERTATARAGITRLQRQKLVEWWLAYHGQAPGPDVTPETMAEKFLSPPARWSTGSPRGYIAVSGVVSVIGPDGKLRYLDKHREHLVGIDLGDEDVRQLLEGKVATLLPCVTIWVIDASWPRFLASPIIPSPRGTLYLWRGTTADRYLEQSREMGLIEIIQEGRFSGSPESLGICPMSQLKDPAGRTYLRGHYQGGMGLVSQFLLPGEGPKVHPPMARVLENLLPEPPAHIKNPSWDATPLIRVKPNETRTIDYYELTDGCELRVPEWVAAVLSVRKTRHGESCVDLLDELSEPGQRFRADVQHYTSLHPSATTADEGFPVYSIV